jgi:hypothetical protein
MRTARSADAARIAAAALSPPAGVFRAAEIRRIEKLLLGLGNDAVDRAVAELAAALQRARDLLQEGHA